MSKLFFLSFLTTGSLSALDIQIDYSFDDNNFFNTAERRNAIEVVADFYGSILQDNLLRIDSSEFSASSTWTASFINPATGVLNQLSNPIIQEDTIIIYVGSRNLGDFSNTGTTLGQAGAGGISAAGGTSGWITRILGRGQAGAAFGSEDIDQITDIGLWGGSIAFNDNEDVIWNFSLENNNSGAEFVAVALHEMAHVLGIGGFAWDNLIVDGVFTGAAATASHGSAPPADTSHFLETLDSPRYGSFATIHGSPQPSLMQESRLDTGSNFDVITDLDLAALVDIGWEVNLPIQFNVVSLSPSQVSFNWPSNSFLSYELIRTSDLQTPSGASLVIVGDGTTQTWNDPAPDPETAFYQLEVSSATSLSTVTTSPPTQSQAKLKSSVEAFETASIEPQVTTGCSCGSTH